MKPVIALVMILQEFKKNYQSIITVQRIHENISVRNR